ncbi:conserved Plasmodium protein, unknown function [Plasmodium berghei]|uniref:Uncharacterized protein n=2 Tax=Plasmodium berghei TaxID=5821 RepID=A0A509ATU1_PLABA|nr:conserved Plasmodium protein, unknown function [Plasmodium berghei ANKA]CXJ13381.1 conserved Plasmodium protein, unknown function [Plasmodium berghei]SCM26128.1 conserved Plasmodium protein, unknown function [Plasmodium berghei]SCN28293.1 conserved Plasmodium protein, unknown function [Plasmodium berghei]SCO64049.1 conserved Plasmodium protein, unknown function [Plasmodium berghei]VUC58182.1 conserved Plasmodium protein, unknown function [Plasmodium berghei ANKA]|eukprot:XP_034423945.1 conserved Plasmodium protein, unknown function [Plasmodium berghei ANKA]
MDLSPNSLKMDKKYINNYNSLEKNYYFMIKEYETISSSRSNIANFRIMKNLLIINSIIDEVKKKHLIEIFENLDKNLVLILKKNNHNFILKLLKIWYIKLYACTDYNINKHFNEILEIIFYKSLSNSVSESKIIYENLSKNVILLTSLVLPKFKSAIIPHIPSLIEYSKKVKRSNNGELKYFYFSCMNKIIKTLSINYLDSEKIYKFMKREISDKEELSQSKIIKCLRNIFIIHPEYSIIECEYFISYITDSINFNKYKNIINVKYIIKFASVIFSNLVNIKYNKSNNLLLIKNGAKENIDSIEAMPEIVNNKFYDKNKDYYSKENKRNKHDDEKKKAYFFTDILKIATDEIISKINKIKVEEKDEQNYVHPENINGFFFQNNKEFNKKIVKKRKTPLSIYNFQSFINHFKNIILNIFSDTYHDYTWVKKLFFLKVLKKYNYFDEVILYSFLNVDNINRKYRKTKFNKYEFFKTQKNQEKSSSYSSTNVNQDNFINHLLEIDYKFMMHREEINCDELNVAPSEDKRILKIYNSLIHNTLLRIIFLESFKNVLFCSKKFSEKSIIKIIKYFISLIDTVCSNCAKKKNIKSPLYTNNISNCFEIKHLIFYSTKIIKQLINHRKKDTYTIIKEKKKRLQRNEKCKNSYNQKHENNSKNFCDETSDDNIFISRKNVATNKYFNKQYNNLDNGKNTKTVERKEKEFVYKNENTSNIFRDQKSKDMLGNERNDSLCNSPCVNKKNLETQNISKEGEGYYSTNVNEENSNCKKGIKANYENDNDLKGKINSDIYMKNCDEEDKGIMKREAIGNNNDLDEDNEEIEKQSLEDLKIRIFLESQIKNYLILNNNVASDVNERKKNNIILKVLIILYNEIIINDNIEKEKYRKYEKIIKNIINNMNGIHIDIDIVRYIINLFLNIFIKFPYYIYNLISLLVNYITIINANFMTSLTLDTFDDVEKQVSILIISSITLKKIIYQSISFYKIYHLDNLIVSIFDICKLFLSKIQVHPLKTINELRRIISYSLIHSIVFIIINQVIFTEYNNKYLDEGMLERTNVARKKSLEINNPVFRNSFSSCNNIKWYWVIYQILYGNSIFRLLIDILNEMMSEIDKARIECFIKSYEEQIKKKKMNSSNFFLVDNLFILVYILKIIYIFLSSEIVTFLFFGHIYKIVNTLFELFYKFHHITEEYNNSDNLEEESIEENNVKSTSKNEDDEDTKKIKKYLSTNGVIQKMEKKIYNKNAISKKKEIKMFYFYEYGFTQMCRLVNIENILLIFAIYLIRIIYKITIFIKYQKFGINLTQEKEMKEKDIDINMQTEKKLNNYGITKGNVVNSSKSNAINNFSESIDKLNYPKAGTLEYNEKEKELMNVNEAIAKVKESKNVYFYFFLNYMINFVKNKDKNDFSNLIINIFKKEQIKCKKNPNKTENEIPNDYNNKSPLLHENLEKLDILNILSNNYDRYYKLTLINIIEILELYLKKYNFFMKIIKNISRCILNVDLNRNEVMVYLLILDKFLKKQMHNKSKVKLFKHILPIIKLLNKMNNNNGLLNVLIIKLMGYFISRNNSEINSYIINLSIKLYNFFSKRMTKENNLYVIFSFLINNIILSYFKINSKKNATKGKSINYYQQPFILENGNTNIEKYININNNDKIVDNNSILGIPFLNISSIIKKNEKEFIFKLDISNIKHYATTSSVHIYSNDLTLNPRKNKKTKKGEKKNLFIEQNKNREQIDKKIKTENEWNNNGSMVLDEQENNKNALINEKKTIFKLFDIFLNMLKIIPQEKNMFIYVLRNFNLVIKKSNGKISVDRIKGCLDIILAYILKNENMDIYNFKIKKAKWVLVFFNNLMRALKKRNKWDNIKWKKKKIHDTTKNDTNESYKNIAKRVRKSKKYYKEIEKQIFTIFEIMLNSYEKKINRRFFKTINSLFDLYKKSKMKKFMSKISILIQKNIFISNKTKLIKNASISLLKLVKKKIYIPMHENFDYYIIALYNFFINDDENDIKMIKKYLFNILKFRILKYSFFNVNEWINLFENVLNAKNIIHYDIKKYDFENSEYDKSDYNKNLDDTKHEKENNLLTNEQVLNENKKKNSIFYTSVFSENFYFNIHIDFLDENYTKRNLNNKKSLYFNIFETMSIHYTFSYQTKLFVMKLLLFFLETITYSSYIYIHNDPYYSNYLKKRLKEIIIYKDYQNKLSSHIKEIKMVAKNNQNTAFPVDTNNFNETINVLSSNGSVGLFRNSRKISSEKNNLRNKSQDSDSDDLDNNTTKNHFIYSDEKKNIKNYSNIYENKNLHAKNKDEMIKRLENIEHIIEIRECLSNSKIIDKGNFKNNMNIEKIIDKFSLYDNFEVLLKVILHNINYGIKFYKLSKLAMKVLIVYLNIFKFSKIIIDELSTNNEILLLQNYEINILASLKTYFESFKYIYINDNNNYEDVNSTKKNGEAQQFSHFFLYPLFDIYNLFLFLNDIKLCNSNTKLIKYFFHFAIKDSTNKISTSFGNSWSCESGNTNSSGCQSSIDNYSEGFTEIIKSANKLINKKNIINTSLFFSEFDACVYFLFIYKSFCYYIINNEEAQNNLANFNMNFVIKNLSYILYDTMILYLWSSEGNNSNGQNERNFNFIHNFFTCVNEKARSLSLFYFSAFPIIIKFLNVVRKKIILDKKYYFFFRTFILFILYILKECIKNINEKTREIYFSFIFNYLIIIGWFKGEYINEVNEISSRNCLSTKSNQNNDPNYDSKNNNINEEKLNKCIYKSEQNDKCNNDESNNENFKNNCHRNINSLEEMKKNTFLRTALYYILKYTVSYINENNLHIVLEFISEVHNNIIENKIEKRDKVVIYKVYTLSIYVVSKFLNNKNINNVENAKLLWNTFLNCYIILNEINDSNFKDKIILLLQKLFLEKINLLLDEKLLSKLLKLFFHYSSINNINNYLTKIKQNYNERIIDFLKKEDLKKLKLEYIKIIVFIHFVSSTDIMEDTYKSYYDKQILDLFILILKIMKSMYFYGTTYNETNSTENIPCNKINDKDIDIKLSHINNNRKHIIISSINIIQNILSLIKNNKESFIFYFICNVIKNGMIPIFITNYSINNISPYSLISSNSYIEDVICYSIKVLKTCFDVFFSNLNITNKMLIPFITFIYKVIDLCKRENIVITKSYLIYETNQEKYWDLLEYQNEELNNFTKYEIYIVDNNMTLYFKESINIFRNIAFKNPEFFKDILSLINAKEKLLIYNLIKESIDLEKQNEQKDKSVGEKLDFSFVN